MHDVPVGQSQRGIGTETAVGFVALPLWGKGQAAVATKPKGRRVVAMIGDGSYQMTAQVSCLHLWRQWLV